MSRELYPFRFKDPVTGKWVRARYRATLADIAARYATWEVTGPASMPACTSIGFSPYRKVMPHAEWTRITEPPLQMHPALHDALERALVQAFLRRYVTYCARRGRYAQMNGAARLLRAVQAAASGPRVGIG
jgi:hypothetical protein